jgi:Tol biopolymer transport system component
MKSCQRIGTLGLCSFLLAVAPALGQQFCPWSTPVNLGTVNSSSVDFGPFISKDGLSLYFTSPRPGSVPGPVSGNPSYDIWVSQRASVSDSWGVPANLGTTINSPHGEFYPSLSPDGHVMFFSSTRPNAFPDSVNNDIYFSRRHNKRDDFGWQTPVNIGDSVNTQFNEAHPVVFEDESSGVITLYFDSNRPGGLGPLTDDAIHNGNDIYASILQPDGTFGPATLVAELSSTSVDRTVTIRRDGLEIFFASDRPGGSGNLDLWTSTRASTSDPWSLPTNLGPTVNSSAREGGPALSFDGTTLYFQSDRPGGLGLLDLWVITRQKLHGNEACESQ